MNLQEYQDFWARVPPRIQALAMFKMAKHVEDTKEPRRPSLNKATDWFVQEAQELIDAIKNHEPAADVKKECADVMNLAMIIFDLMDDRQTKHGIPAYWYQLARDSGIGLKEGN